MKQDLHSRIRAFTTARGAARMLALTADVAPSTISRIIARGPQCSGWATLQRIEAALEKLEAPTNDQGKKKGSSTVAKSRQVAAPQSAKKPAKTVGIPLFAQKSVWACGTLGSAVDVNSRLDMLRSFSAHECRLALADGNIQKTVRLALERRLRRLEAGK